MTPVRRRALASVLGTALLAALLLLVSLDGLYQVEPREVPVYREVQMYVPPPRPPQAQARDDASRAAGPSLTLANRPTEVALELMSLDVNLSAGQLGDLGFGGDGFGEGLGLGDGTVGLSELDGQPFVMNAPIFLYPEELAEQGITEFRVVFHIMIDESGGTHPLGIVENPYPQHNEALMAFATGVRFSPPTRLGIPVRTEYGWPVLFKAPTPAERTPMIIPQE